MPHLDLACACGAVAWRLTETTPRCGVRYVCHCDDCQAYARFLGAADRVLDVHGGTDAYQLPASRFQVTAGREDLACVQVTARPVLRWYCRRCRTPVANTYHTSRLSFLSLPLPRTGAAEIDAALGPPSGHVWTKFGRGDLSEAPLLNIPAMLWRMGARIIAARITGDYRRNPLFDPATTRPIAPPRVLTPAERAELAD